MISKSSFKENVILFFLIIFFIFLSTIIYKDYSVSVDEVFYRNLGYYWYLFILEKANLVSFEIYSKVALIYKNQEYSKIFSQKNEIFYATFYNIFLSFLESILNITDYKKIYYFRHLLNNFFFIISAVYFYFLIKLRFNNLFLPFFGFISYICSPRIFAESFFNPNDIPFMCINIITIYYLIKTIANFNFLNIFVTSILLSLFIGFRQLCIFLIFFFLYLILSIIIENKFFFKKNYIKIIFSFVAIISFTVFFNPYLWDDPSNLFKSFFNLKKSMLDEIFFFGDYYKTNQLPWYYIPVNIFSTLPFFYSLFAIIGFLIIFYVSINRFLLIDKKKFISLKDKKFIFDYFFLIYFFFTIYICILLNVKTYGSWRHFFFLYPVILYFLLFFVDFLFNNLTEYKKLIKALLILIILNNFYIIYKLHPFQNLYFNFLFKNNANKNFEIDYWGLSNLHAMRKILKDSDKEKINIKIASFTPFERSLIFLTDTEKKRINHLGTNVDNADYIFSNFIYEKDPKFQKKYSIPMNYKIIFSLYLDNILIYKIYKKI